MNLRIGLDMDIGREFAVKLQHLMVGGVWHCKFEHGRTTER
jgi:hypothetical protein